MMKQGRKYVAEGFLEDSAKLLDDFIKLNSVEFKDFASVWRKHYFSLIFMGRPTPTETNEFVNEIFRLSSLYLMEVSFLKKVGAVFLLYGLFLKQLHNDRHPRIMIRIEIEHFKVIKSLRSEAIEKEMKSLHYVIDYLIKNAFLYVANQTLRGPHVSGIPSYYDVFISQRKKECAENLEGFYTANNLEKMGDFNKKYADAKKKIPDRANLTLIKDNAIYNDVLEKLENLAVNQLGVQGPVNIGGARPKIKAEAFKKKARPNKRYTATPEDLNIPVVGSVTKYGRVKKPEDCVKEVKVPKRIPREARKPGRPPHKPKPQTPPESNSSDEEIDITHLLTQQKAIFGEIKMFGRTKQPKVRREPYYELSPTREENIHESDPDNPE